MYNYDHEDQELSYKEIMSIKQHVKEFWTYFLKNENQIRQALDLKDMKKIHEWNEKLGEQCLKTAGCYVSLEKDDEIYCLIFEPMKDKTSQIICLYLTKFAPKTLKDWVLFDCIPPLNEKIFHYRFEVEDKTYSIEEMKIGFTETGKHNDTLDVSLVCEGFEKMNEHEKEVIAETFVQNVLGDLVLNCYVDNIECSAHEKEDIEYVALKDGYDVLIDFMDLHHYKTYSDCTQIYSVYKKDEAETGDELLDDRILISTIHPLNFVEVMNQERTSLNQITRLGGEVGFLVMDIDVFDEKTAYQKRVLEKELNELLYDLGIARICGSGVALKRIYFEVFIFDKEEFKQAVVKIVQRLNLEFKYIAY